MKCSFVEQCFLNLNVYSNHLGILAEMHILVNVSHKCKLHVWFLVFR